MTTEGEVLQAVRLTFSLCTAVVTVKRVRTYNRSSSRTLVRQTGTKDNLPKGVLRSRNIEILDEGPLLFVLQERRPQLLRSST